MNQTQKTRTCLLLVNLGSPEAPTTRAVRRYLREFLSDRRVVNIPRFIWLIILNLFVLPFRPRTSAAAYQKIWTQQGSPLVFISQQLTEALAQTLDETVSVKLAMRYGSPAIVDVLAACRKQEIQRLVVLPLYPQFSTTTTASVFDVVLEQIKHWPYLPDFHFISAYYQYPQYIAAIAASIEAYWHQQGQADKLLFSFHGLPAKSIEWGDPYYKQCHETANLVVNKLGLQKQAWQIVFQSRFGRAQWLQPYCIDVLQQLPAQGVKRVDVVCPGFSVDCLETLEEIALANKAIFIAAGGEQYRYIPALNATRRHVQVLSDIVEKYI